MLLTEVALKCPVQEHFVLSAVDVRLDLAALAENRVQAALRRGHVWTLRAMPALSRVRNHELADGIQSIPSAKRVQRVFAIQEVVVNAQG